MIFITKSGKEIEVPNDYTYMSIEKFAKEIYQQGRADAIDELKNALYERTRDKGIYASEYIAFIDCTFGQLKGTEE